MLSQRYWIGEVSIYRSVFIIFPSSSNTYSTDVIHLWILRILTSLISISLQHVCNMWKKSLLYFVGLSQRNAESESAGLCQENWRAKSGEKLIFLFLQLMVWIEGLNSVINVFAWKYVVLHVERIVMDCRKLCPDTLNSSHDQRTQCHILAWLMPSTQDTEELLLT